MTIRNSLLAVVALLLVQGLGVPQTSSEAGKSAPNTVQVHMVATVEPLEEEDNAVAPLSREDVKVQQGRNNLQVAGWIPARGDQAALQLFILIDDTNDPVLGSNLNELREFIKAQPPTTVIGLAYMRNTTISIVQNFTQDHAQVAKAMRLPLGNLGASDSPYLSLISLLKGWPESKARREVLMISDGIDRLRGNFGPGAPMGAAARGLPYMSPDIDRASREAQRSGVIVHSIYARGVGHAGRNFWEINNGQNGLSKLADETGGESFFLGTQNPPSFQPWLARLQTILDNQYFLVFQAIPGRRADLQRVRVSTEKPKVEIVTADGVWVPAAAPATGGED